MTKKDRVLKRYMHEVKKISTDVDARTHADIGGVCTIRESQKCVSGKHMRAIWRFMMKVGYVSFYPCIMKFDNSARYTVTRWYAKDDDGSNICYVSLEKNGRAVFAD